MPLLTNGFYLGSLIMRDDVTTPWQNGPIRTELALATTLQEISFLDNYTYQGQAKGSILLVHEWRGLVQ